MLSDADKASIEKGFIRLQIIWGSIFACLFVYLIIAFLIGGEIQKNLQGQIPITLIRNILIFVSVIEILVINFLRKKMLQRGEFLKANEQQGVPLEQSPYLARYMSAIIISTAIAESIGIYGLVLFFLGASINTLYLFLGASAIVMIYFRPKKEELMEFASSSSRE